MLRRFKAFKPQLLEVNNDEVVPRVFMTFTELTADFQFRVYIHDVTKNKDVACLVGAQAVLCDVTTEAEKIENEQMRRYFLLADPYLSEFVATSAAPLSSIGDHFDAYSGDLLTPYA